MIKTYKIECSDDFKSCDYCIHSGDTENECKSRMCVHALENRDIKDCYEHYVSIEKIKKAREQIEMCANLATNEIYEQGLRVALNIINEYIK